MSEQHPQPGLAGGRERRKRTGLVITDEKLLWALQNEALGNDQWELPKDERPARPPRPPGDAAPGRPGAPAAAPNGKHAAGGDGGRPAKRIKPTLLPGGGSVASGQAGPKGSGPHGGSRSRGGSEGADSGEEEGGQEDPTAETAWEVGLNGAGLMEEEEGLLPPGADQATYVRVRNQVLCMWRRDVSRRLSEEEAVAGMARLEHRPYALAAHRFLSALGFINFGVSPAQQRQLATARQDAGSVLVVGAGCAGLAAARQLRAAGYRVVVVEARDRPGGRVWSERLEARGARAVADIGGSIITGIDGNPLAVLVKQMRLPLADIRNDTPLYFADGTEPDPALDSAVESLHNDLLDECNELKAAYERTGGDMSLGVSLETLWDASKADIPALVAEQGGSAAAAAAAPEQTRRLFDWHMANLEFANSCQVDTLSLMHWDQDDPNEMMGAHCFLPGGNGRWLQELCRELPIFYGSPVREIRHCAAGVAVQTDRHCFQADAVVVTLPLGVLKRKEAVRFSPPLSQRKLDSIRRIGFGPMNKIIMLFPSPFWGDSVDMFGKVAEAGEDRGEAFLFYSYAHISGGALLIALCSGEAAVKLERKTPAEAGQSVMRVLRAIYEPRGVEVPPPLQVMTTRWGSDEFAYGSYSSMPVGTLGGADYDRLAESVGGRVFFAGEATTRKYPATMHGAFLSGLEAAANVDATLRFQRRHPPRPAAAAVSANASAAGPMAAARVAAAGAAARPATSAVSKPAPAAGAAAVAIKQEPAQLGAQQQQAHALDEAQAQELAEVTAIELEAAAEELGRAERLAASLQRLFSDERHPPDLEVAGVAVIHAPPGAGASLGGQSPTTEGSAAAAAGAAASPPDQQQQQQQSLVRVDGAALRGGGRRVALGDRFLVVTRGVAESLADAPSVDARLALLESLPAYRFAGRQQVQAEALVTAIEAHRQAAGQQQGQGQQRPGSRGGGWARPAGFRIPRGQRL